MNGSLDTLLSESMRVVVLIIIPSLAVVIASFLTAFLQGTLGIQESTGLYAVRVLALVGVLAIFGNYFGEALTTLLKMGLGPQ